MKPPPKDWSFLASVFRILTGQETYLRQGYSGVDYPYRAAEIVVEDCACNAVRGLTGTRFLMDEVPLLPVPDCTARKCVCRYVRYRDRRNSYEGRRAEFSALTTVYTTIGNTERRGRVDRRVDEVALDQRL